MKTLELHALDRIDHLVWPDDHVDLDLHSPATAIFTDFRRSEPLTVNADMMAPEAERLVRRSHIGMWIVVDEHGDVDGLIGREQLDERTRLLARAPGQPYGTLCVRDLMIPRHHLRAIDREALEQATVGDIVETLRTHGDRHCLVVSHADHEICGLIAASDIARRLQTPIQVDGPPTFAQIHAAVRG